MGTAAYSLPGSLDLVVYSTYEQCDCPTDWLYSQLVVRWYTVTTYDLYLTQKNTTYRRDGTYRRPATNIIRRHVYNIVKALVRWATGKRSTDRLPKLSSLQVTIKTNLLAELKHQAPN